MYGAIGNPTRVSKTVVTGEDHQKVSTIVSVLSYFIRCTHVEDAFNVPEILDPQNVLSYDDSLKMTNVKSASDMMQDDFVLIERKDTTSKDLNNSVKVKVKKQSNLHRSRSSPFGAVNHNSDSNLSKRTTSSDLLCRSRFVQSRRKSQNCSQTITFNIDSESITIPSVKDIMSDSLDCNSSFPNEDTNSKLNEKSVKTHKRVNSEPFKILKTGPVRCQETFVGNLEPKIEQLNHVQSEATFFRPKMKENVPPFNVTSSESKTIFNSNTSNKQQNKRVATRRHKLIRTPSVQLNHDDFDQYFDDDDDDNNSEIKTPVLPIIEHNPPLKKIEPVRAAPVRPPPPLPTKPPVHNGPLKPVSSENLPKTNIYPKLPPIHSTPIRQERPTTLYPSLDSKNFGEINNDLFKFDSKPEVRKLYPVLPDPSCNSSIDTSEKEPASNEREEMPITNIQKTNMKPHNNRNFGYGNLMTE